MQIKNSKLFEQLIEEALKQEFSGWDFSFVAEPWQEASTSWDYPQIVRSHIKPEYAMLDMDTGGGEVLFLPAPSTKHVRHRRLRSQCARCKAQTSNHSV